MNRQTFLTLLIFTVSLSFINRHQCSWAQETDKQPPGKSTAETQTGTEKVLNITDPGPAHKFLEKFIGQWDVETRFVMNGKKSDPSPGVCNYSWQIKDRWLKSEISGTFMGQPVEGFTLLGYDNFKQSYVATSIQNMDTAMLRFEGDLSQDKRSLVMYGQMDEYLTGEHDKMVKYAFRFKDDDTIVFEIHDLHIGETNSMVIEQTLKRKKKTTE